MNALKGKDEVKAYRRLLIMYLLQPRISAPFCRKPCLHLGMIVVCKKVPPGVRKTPSKLGRPMLLSCLCHMRPRYTVRTNAFNRETKQVSILQLSIYEAERIISLEGKGQVSIFDLPYI